MGKKNIKNITNGIVFPVAPNTRLAVKIALYFYLLQAFVMCSKRALIPI
jgi:hypothetical protein